MHLLSYLASVPKSPLIEITLLLLNVSYYTSEDLNELNMNGGSIFIFPSSK